MSPASPFCPVIPRPANASWRDGQFEINADTVIAAGEQLETKACQLAEMLKQAAGFDLQVASAAAPARNVVLLQLDDGAANLGDEGYSLTITSDRIIIRAPASTGIYYGAQTLRQLVLANATHPSYYIPGQDQKGNHQPLPIPALEIEDKPRFAWRHLHLDVSRHFFTKEEIEHFLEVMAAHKFNIFHWHLVDDHGWRIEIKRYPKLTGQGAWREALGFGLDPGASRNYRADGMYGGFYTQEELREIVAYAAERHITIVPEIELPGHSAAALHAYPEFHCTGAPPDTGNRAGVFRGVYCAGKEETFAFLENVFSEVLSVFPGAFIHIGGDEVPKDNWKVCPACQARMKSEGLNDEDELQSYFIRRIETSLNARQRRLVGWDEILEGGLAPNATVMSWRGTEGGIAAAHAGHDVVMTPTSHCYFDYYQHDVAMPTAICGCTPLEKVYEFDPVPPEISPDRVRHVLGGGANLWTEFIPNYGHLQYMTWPRACAMAEVLWSEKNGRTYDEFLERLNLHAHLLRMFGVRYARWMSDGRWV